MKFRLKIIALIASLAGVLAAADAAAAEAERRLALVVGNANYGTKPLETTANDAGLIAQTLQAAGFDVTGARDLDEDALRHSFRDFVDKAGAAGPETVVFVYFAGYALQLEGENYLLPVGADIRRDADIPSRAIRVSDYMRSLGASGLKAGVVVVDAARENPLPLSETPVASGLALYEPGPRMLLAFNAAPGTIAPREQGPYGAYAHALSEMIRDGGLSLTDVFDRVRLRVEEMTKGAQLPWNSPGFDPPFVFFERAADAPAPPEQIASVRMRPIAELGPRDGYAAAVQRDTLQGYQDFVATYPRDPSAKRVRAIIAIRREAITWRRTRVANTPNAYWSYLRRYPRGPHVWDARRRLAQLAAAYDPPPSFEMIDYDVPPPPPDEIVYVDRPVFIFDDPDFGFAPPPPPPVYLLPPPPPEFVVLPPPVVVAEAYALPMPAFVPLPSWKRPPAYVAPPPSNLIFENLHNQVIVDNASNNVVIKDPGGQLLSSTALKAAAIGAAAGAIGAALPAYLARKANLAPPGAPRAYPAAPPHSPGVLPLPGGAPPLGQVPGGIAPLAPRPPIAPAANLHTPPNALPLPGPGPAAAPDAPAKPGRGEVAPAGLMSPAATLHAPPNARPLPTGAPLGQSAPGKIGVGHVPPGLAGGAPAAKLTTPAQTPAHVKPLPAPGAAAPGESGPAKPAGHAPAAAPSVSPAATLHTPPNARPLPVPGMSLGGGPGKPARHEPPVGPGATPAATLHAPPTVQPSPVPGMPPDGGAMGKRLAPPPHAKAAGREHAAPVTRDQPPTSARHAPAMHPPVGEPARTLDIRARGVAPAVRGRPQPPPGVVDREAAPAAAHTTPPVRVHREMAPPLVHAPPAAVVRRQAPPPLVHAPQPAAPHHAAPRVAPIQAPPHAYRPPPAPAAVMRAPAPPPHAPPAAHQGVGHSPPPGARRCQIVNGVPICR